MSKNKRSRRLSKDEAILSVLSADETTSNASPSAVVKADIENEAVKSSMLDRLKKNWMTVGLIALLSFGALGAGLKYLEESAKKENAARAKENNFTRTEPSLMSKLNPFVTTPTPTPTPQLSKEYIYAGSRMLAVEDANANAAPPADLAVWRPNTGYWYVLGGTGSAQTSFQWGGSGDIPAVGDYDGDGKTDFAVWRSSNGTWYITRSSDSSSFATTFGQSGDKLAQADYDGDGKTDIAVYRAGWWYVLKSSDQTILGINYGASSDFPAPKDYDGDGKADLCVWRPGDATFYTLKSSSNYTMSESATMPQTTSDQVVSADYDGDGKFDYAIRYNNTWIIRSSSTGTIQTPHISWQSSVDVSVQNDYDGDGKVDIAVWNASTGTWYIRQSSNGQTRTEQWGGTINGTADIPVPAFYRR